MNISNISLLNTFYKKIKIFFYTFIWFIFSTSYLNAETILFNDGFESANLNNFACSGNCPSITTSPTKTGKYAGNYVLKANMPFSYRTESVFKGKGDFERGKEYWYSMDYRYEDWVYDASPEIAPFQVHVNPSTYENPKCNLSAAVSTAPFLMVSQNNEVLFKTYNKNILWRGPIERKKWLNITVHFKLSSGKDGFIEAWKNGVKLGRVDGPTGPALDNCGKPMRKDYLKIGIYKWDWRKYKKTDSDRRQLLIDNVKIKEGENGFSIKSSSSITQSSATYSKEKVLVDTSAPLISNIQTAITDTKAVITWDTNEASSSIINYGTSSNYGNSKSNNLLVTNHSITLSNLIAGKKYHFQIVSKDNKGNTKKSDNLNFIIDAPDQKDLIAHWSMNKQSGSKVVDISGNGHAASLVNGATLIKGQGVKLDGVNDYLNAGKLNISGNAITMSAWFLADDLSNCSARDCRIISKATGTSEQDHYFMVSTIKKGANTRLRFRLKTNGVTSTLIAASGNIQNNQWTHVTAVYNGHSMRLYKDGVEVGSMAKKGSITTNSNAAMWIGANPPSAKSRSWKGLIDDVQIYPRALSSSKILDLANSYNPSEIINDDLPPKISNVQVAVTNETAIISWNTNEASESLVEYGLTRNYNFHSDNNGLLVTNHQITLNNLAAEKLYHYQISSKDNNGNIGNLGNLTFTTKSNIEKGLIAHWSMDEQSGSKIVDISGNGHAASLVNGATLIKGQGVKLDGVNDYLNAGKLNISGNAITMSAWFLADDLSNCSARDCRIISKATGTSEQDHYFMVSTIKKGSKTRLRFRLKTNGVTSTLIAVSGNIKNNQWTHVTAVYDGHSMRLYKDGVEVGSMAKKGSITTNSKAAMWIGANPPSAKSRAWKGLIDNVQIYSYAMTPSEITKKLLN